MRRRGAVLAVTLAMLLAACGGDDSEETSTTTRDDKSTTTKAEGGGALSTKEVFEVARPSTVRLVGKVEDGVVGGSGVIIDAEEGLVLTNNHVVTGVASLRARINDEDDVAARVVATAPCDDLALVELVNPPELTAIKLGDSETVENEDEVLVLGYPASFEVGETELISTSGRVQSPDVAAEPGPGGPRLPSTIQHSATVNPGNSGGPLLNDKAELIGINTLGYLDAEAGVENQFYSIAINHIKRLLPDLREGESKADVGWNIAPFSQVPLSDVFEFTGYGTAEQGAEADRLLAEAGVDGLFVLSVEEGSPAEEAILEFGDLIESIKGAPVTTVAEVCDVLQSARPGETLPLEGRYTTNSPGEEFAEQWETELVLPE